MPLSTEQFRQLFEEFWANGSAECPACNRAPIRFHYEGSNLAYALVIRCPRGCGMGQMTNDHDPLKGTFRKWTDQDLDTFVDNHFAHQRSRCPVDGADVVVSERRYMGGTIVNALCRRCLQHAGKDFPTQSP